MAMDDRNGGGVAIRNCVTVVIEFCQATFSSRWLTFPGEDYLVERLLRMNDREIPHNWR